MPKIWSVFGLGMWAANVHKLWGVWGPFGGGSRTFGMVKSSCMCRVASVSPSFAYFQQVLGRFWAKKRADFGP